MTDDEAWNFSMNSNYTIYPTQANESINKRRTQHIFPPSFIHRRCRVYVLRNGIARRMQAGKNMQTGPLSDPCASA